MPHCVRALLSNDVLVNPPEYRYRRDHEGDMDVKISWYETPLDSTIVARDRKVKEMQRESVHTLDENEDILRKLNAVIVTIQDAGGICKRHTVKSEPFVYDLEKYGKRGFVRALRESGTSLSAKDLHM
jgi:hypothetical protein